MAGNNYNLNIAAGNLYNVSLTISKTNVALMRLEQEIRSETAQNQQIIQNDCYRTGISSASEAKTALDKEASGLESAGALGFVGAGFSLAALGPPKLAGLFGSDATETELDETNKLDEKVSQEIENRKPQETVKTSEPQEAVGTENLEEKTKLPVPGVPGDPETRATGSSAATEGKDSPANVTLNDEPRNPWKEKRFGNMYKRPDLSGISKEDFEQIQSKSLNQDELKTLQGNLVARKRELEQQLYSQRSQKLSSLSQVGNAFATTGQIGQGYFKGEQAQSEAASQEYSTQTKIFEQVESGFSSFNSNAQQMAGSFQEEAMSILNFNAIQA